LLVLGIVLLIQGYRRLKGEEGRILYGKKINKIEKIFI